MDDETQSGPEAGAGSAAVRRHPQPETATRYASDAGQALAPDTYDAERGTVEVIWSTGAGVVRRDFWTGERWIEELDLAGARLDRLNAGGPLLLDHYASVSNVAGSIVPGTARVENGRGVALLRFDRDGEAGRLAEQKVAGGHLRTVSIGYRVARWEKVRAASDGELDRQIARDWEVYEISIVPVPADAGAVMRSAAPSDIGAPATRAGDAARNPEVRMDPTETEGAAQSAAATTPDAAAIRQEERARTSGILTAARALGLDDVEAQRMIDAGTSLADAQAEMIRSIAQRQQADGLPRHAAVTVTRDEGETLRRRWEGALTARLLGRAPSEEAREFAGMGFHALMREIAVRNRVPGVHRMSGQDLAEMFLDQRQSMHTTSDFPLVLANSANKSVQALFAAYPNTWSAWTREIEVPDFKTITAASIGQFPEVAAIAEGAPYTFGSIAEEGQTYAVQERGRLVALSRQAIVNDDARAFQDVLQGAAMAGYTALRRVVFGILTTNAVWPTGGSVALFNGARNNLGTAGNLSATTYAELRALLAKQTSPARAGESAASLPPPTGVVLLVGPDEEDTAMELLGNRIVPTATGAVLPDGYRASTAMVMEPFLDVGNDPYYLCRSDIRGVEIAYLQGRRAPTISSAEDIKYSGVTFRVVFDFGAAAVQPRVMAANLG